MTTSCPATPGSPPTSCSTEPRPGRRQTARRPGAAARTLAAGALASALAAALPLPAAAGEMYSASFPPLSVITALPLTGAATATTVAYSCTGRGEPLVVTYVNDDPNHLAIVPVEAGRLIFAAVVSASGARYAAGFFVWWSHARGADLYDLRSGEAAPPVLSCTEPPAPAAP